MRKLSELYQVVLDYYDSDNRISPYICDSMTVLNKRVIINFGELLLLQDHFKNGNHKHINRGFTWWPIDDIESRIEYLKYLIELCKEQDI